MRKAMYSLTVTAMLLGAAFFVGGVQRAEAQGGGDACIAEVLVDFQPCLDSGAGGAACNDILFIGITGCTQQ